MARSDLIRSLYSNLKDKSKVYPNKRVTRVEPTEAGVKVLTEDGSVWTGSIVVGADGVRSMVRREMWRIAREQKSDLLGEEDGKCKTWLSSRL
jgi:2-polyprenyl-6-methoxyphenol hydroxylase-like FAD-dependent oxidoreductase